MSLTPEEIAKYRSQAGLSPSLPSPAAPSQDVINSRLSEFNSAIGQTEPSPKGFIGNTADAIKSGAGQIKSGFEQVKKGATANEGIGKGAYNLVSGAGQMAAGGINAALSPVAGAIGATGEKTHLGKPIGQAVDYAANKLNDLSEYLGIPLSTLVTKYPGIEQDVSNAITIGGAVAGGAKLPEIGAAAKGAVDAGAGLLSKAKAAKVAKTAAGETSKITEMISPKPTVKEAKLAQTQGRLVEGKKPTMFKAGTEDTITPSKKTIDATQTIQKNIPDAAKMSEPELYKAVDKHISDTATKLRPQMEATPIHPDTISKINDDWTSLKKSQIEDAPATEEANVIKRQNKFESLLKKSGNESHADLWDTRIKYDDSIPEGVKKANSMSPESLQIQKEEWLQNRSILNDAIDSSAKPEFKAMSDMYEAKNGILSKTKIKKAQPSKLNEWIKENPKKVSTLKAVVGIEVLKSLGIHLP